MEKSEGIMPKESFKKIVGTIKRVRVRKKEKTKRIPKIKMEKHSRSYDSARNNEIKAVDNSRSSGNVIPGRITEVEKDNKSNVKDDNQKDVEVTIDSKRSANLISFEHELTEFEMKLKYLNLKDIDGQEFGGFFPPIKSKLMIIDEEGRDFSALRAGRNQISGELFAFFRENKLVPGDILIVEYDRDETADDGRHILHMRYKG